MKDQMTMSAGREFGAERKFDAVAIEWQAREMRAAFLADTLRSVATRVASLGRSMRGAGTAHTA